MWGKTRQVNWVIPPPRNRRPRLMIALHLVEKSKEYASISRSLELIGGTMAFFDFSIRFSLA